MAREVWEELDAETRGRILKVGLELRRYLKPVTVRHYVSALVMLASLGNLDRVEEMERLIDALDYSPGHLLNIRAAYRHYCRIYRLPEPQFRRRLDRRRRLPRLPDEETLKMSLAIPRYRIWRAYLRLLYETGARPSEALRLRVRDVDLKAHRVRLGTLKMAGYTDARILPISPRLTGLLEALMKEKEPHHYIFSQRGDPSKPRRYSQAEAMIRHVKRHLIEAGYPEAELLTLYSYRHAYATRLYRETGDLALVQRALGHRDLSTTMIYLHVQPLETPRYYDVVHLSVDEADEIARLLSEGWEVALQTESRVWLRRRRWP